MAEYSRREVTTVRVEYVLASGSVIAEFGKAWSAAARELGDEASQWDDAARVEARDDEVVIWFEKSKDVTS